ncbi:MAG TPA: hypothetical protein VMB47_09610 [Candidatus Aquilonibacter sp.]|nr:hypothetical protein [Candidatus Aquilonibacter sp.]
MPTADLRPMTLGEVLDRTFKLYKTNFWLFAGIMSLPFLVLFFFNVGIAWFTTSQVTAFRAGHVQSAGPLVAAGAGSVFLIMILTFVLTGIGEAATVFAVSDIYLGRPVSIRGSFNQVRGHVLQVLGTIFLTALAIGAGFIALIIPGIILMCRLGLAVPAAMLEDIWPGTALSRSMDLTKSFGMQMFLIFLLTFILAAAVTSFCTFPFLIIAAMRGAQGLPFGMVVLQDAASFVAQVIAAPVQTIAFSLMYYNLRVRKEGFDIEHLMGSLNALPTSVMPASGSALPS